MTPGPLSARASTPPRGVRDHHVPCYRWRTYVCKTLACKAHGTLPRHIWKTVHPTATTTPPAGDWQDAGVISARPRTTATPDAMPHSVLPTVLDHCTPAIRGKYDGFHDPLPMYSVPSCVYKRRRRASFKGVVDVTRSGPLDRTQHSVPLKPDIGTRLNQLLL